MKLFIGICNSQDFVPAGFFWTFINLKSNYNVQACRGGQPWDIVRNNYLISKFLKSDADIFIKMDIDQIYPNYYLKRFVPLVEEYKVIGPMIKDRNKGNDHMPLSFSSHNGLELRKYPVKGKKGIVEIPYSHTNLFIKREVLEQIPPPWYKVSYSEDGLYRDKHVDFSFLDKIKDAGYPIYIDLDVTVGHLKQPEYVT